MLFISTENLKPGMILAMDIYVYNNTFKILLLKEGQSLNNQYIDKIHSNYISGVYVKNEALKHNIFEKSIDESLEAGLLTKIKDIFYMYKINSGKFNTKLIWQISEFADELIMEILFNSCLSYRTLEFNNYDDYIFQHNLNVAILSISLGNSLGISQHMLHELAVAALLHDIGMTLIPLEIVNKLDKLTVEEFKIIKVHSVNTVNQLKSYVSNDILMGISSHHEKADGTGYPYGLKCNQTHLFARILSICDVYQSMNTSHLYRKAYAPSDIIQYLLQGTNTQFDEKILKLFLENIIIYPIGTLVKLSNCKTAIVVKNYSENVLRPVVRIINSDDSFGNDIDLMYDETQFNIVISGKGHNFEYIVSSCLCGEKCRYDGKVFVSEKVNALINSGRAIMVCAEILGGMTVPRLPCEINNNRVYNITSDDKTEYYINGARKVLDIAKKYGINKAVLKEKSPSCGSNFIYDGTFSRTLIHGEGIATKLLRENGVEVISDEEFETI